MARSMMKTIPTKAAARKQEMLEIRRRSKFEERAKSQAIKVCYEKNQPLTNAAMRK